MAGWNKSSGEAKPTPKKNPSVLKGAAAGGVCVAVAAVVAFFVLMGKNEKPKAKVEKKIVQVKAAKEFVKSNETVSASLNNTTNVWTPPKGAYKDERGIWHHRGGARLYDPTRRNPVSLALKGTKKYPFKFRSEQVIAALIATKPGSVMLGGRRFDERFIADYEASLKEPIIVSESDSEEDKILKRMMIETKIEIADRMQAGERLQDILSAAQKELCRMSEYKRNIDSELNKIIKTGEISVEDADSYIEAANKMLESNGIEPIRNVSFIKRNIRLHQKEKER